MAAAASSDAPPLEVGPHEASEDAGPAAPKRKFGFHMMKNKDLCNMLGCHSMRRDELISLAKKRKVEEHQRPEASLDPTCPGRPRHGASSGLWLVFKITESPKTFKDSAWWREIQCLLCGDVFQESARASDKRRSHLSKKHQTSWSQFQTFTAEQTRKWVETKEKPCVEPCPAEAQALVTTSQKCEEKVQRVIASMLASQSSANKKLQAAWARSVNIAHDVPLWTRPEMTDFFTLLAQVTGAKLVWRGPERNAGHRSISTDLKAMWRLIWDEFACLGVHEGTIHHDEWETPTREYVTALGLSYITEDFRDRVMAIGCFKAAEFSSREAGTERQASTQATTLEAAWKEFVDKKPEGSERRSMPPFAMSDNCNTALCTTRLLDRLAARCGAHLVYIPVKRINFEPSREDGVPLAPILLEKLTVVREWARVFKDGETMAHWSRAKQGGEQNQRLHADSSADWGTTLSLLVTACKLRYKMAEFSMMRGDMPTVLREREWKLLELNRDILQVIQNGQLLLQKDDSKAAQLLPVITAIRNELLDMTTRDPDPDIPENLPKIYLEQIDRMITVHLKSPWAKLTRPPKLLAILQAAGISTYYDLLEVAAALAIGVSCDEDSATFRTLVDKFAGLCVSLHPRGAEEAIQLSAKRRREAPVASKDNNEGMTNFLQKLKPPVKRPRVDEEGADATVASTIRRQVTTFFLSGEFPGAASGTDILRFWRHRKQQYAELIPGVRVLLSLPAGNAAIERFFGDCRASSGAQRTSAAPSRPRNVLRHNGPQLRMEGLTSIRKHSRDEPEDSEEGLSNAEDAEEVEVLSD